jgi:hypothetical protein
MREDEREAEARWAVVKEAWTLIRRAEAVQDETELKDMAGKLAPMIIASWDVSPYSAMETLEGTTLALPLNLARTVIKESVEGWRRKPNYKASAHNDAGHCYLSALILSGNYDMAEHPWADGLLAYVLDKDTSPSYVPRKMKDRDKKMALLMALQPKSTTEKR